MPGFVIIGGSDAVGEASHRRRRSILGLLTSLFFIWGFITVIDGTRLPHLKSAFQLSHTQTTCSRASHSSPNSWPWYRRRFS